MDRHLLPDEIDQLLDGETGFGIAPLEAHVRSCAQCRAELDAGRRVVDAMEHLPRLAPSALFADRIMSQVHVYEPWDVAARDALAAWARRLVPQSRPLRVAAGTVGLSLFVALSIASVWLGTHLETVFFVGSIARTRLRDALVEQLGALVTGLFGARAVDVLGGGRPVVVFGVLCALVALLVLSTVAVRSVVSTSRGGRT